MLTEDILSLARILGEVLTSTNRRVTTAESCTGGLIASALTETPGSSAWFEQGIVSYSNAVKMRLLDVKETTLNTHGAVSEAVAREMAIGARQSAGADLAISVTGIAGPDGGSAQKPVGTVCFAWATPGQAGSATCHFVGNRQSIRLQSVKFALETLLQQAEL